MIKQTIIDIVDSLQKDNLDYELLKIKDEALKAIATQDLKFQHHTIMAYVSNVNTFKKYRYSIIENYTPANDFNDVLEDGYIDRVAYGYKITKEGLKFYDSGGYRWLFISKKCNDAFQSFTDTMVWIGKILGVVAAAIAFYYFCKGELTLPYWK